MSKHILQVGTAKIKTDENDMVSLTDIWKAALAVGKADGKMEPKQWSKRDIGTDAIESTAKSLKVPVSHLYKTVKGKYGGTYAHILVATAYASYLHPDLATEIRATYLRAVSGDVSLADEIVDRAKPEDVQKHLVRTAGIVTRNEFTATLGQHGVHNHGFGTCTNAIYVPILGGTAAELRELRNLPAKSNVRTTMSAQEIILTAHAEMIATRDIKSTRAYGNDDCTNVCTRAAKRVASL